MKWVTPVVVLALGVAAILLPSSGAPQPGPIPGTVAPPIAVCPTSEDGRSTTEVDIVSTVAGAGEITIFSGGGSVGSSPIETGASGSDSIDIGDIAAVGDAAALVEFPVSETAAAAITRGARSLSAELCSRIPDRQVVVGGGSTIEDRIFQIRMMNPYSAEALVDITAFSESGRESAETLRSIVVPARSSVMVDLATLLPGRERLNLVVEATRGSVVTTASIEMNGDEAVWQAVAPEEIWYVPIPVWGGSRQIVIASSTPADVAFQVDVFGPEGLEEAAIEGTVAAGGQEVVGLAGLTAGPLAVRVVATAPVGVFARLYDSQSVAIAAGSPVVANEWLIPGAGTGQGIASRITLVNVGVEPTQVTVNELRAQSRSRVVALQPNEVAEVVLDEIGSDGVSLLADSQVIPIWVGQGGGALALSGGYPLLTDE